ncbi:hypothetical protein J6590_092335 [Homalodisca vitripennis]|nr:hypothetical protein J6590_092335 [Homalodisca vitripennis]
MLVRLRLQTPPSNKSKGFSTKAAAFVIYWEMLQSGNQCEMPNAAGTQLLVPSVAPKCGVVCALLLLSLKTNGP